MSIFIQYIQPSGLVPRSITLHVDRQTNRRTDIRCRRINRVRTITHQIMSLWYGFIEILVSHGQLHTAPFFCTQFVSLQKRYTLYDKRFKNLDVECILDKFATQRKNRRIVLMQQLNHQPTN